MTVRRGDPPTDAERSLEHRRDALELAKHRVGELHGQEEADPRGPGVLVGLGVLIGRHGASDGRIGRRDRPSFEVSADEIERGLLGPAPDLIAVTR